MRVDDIFTPNCLFSDLKHIYCYSGKKKNSYGKLTVENDTGSREMEHKDRLLCSVLYLHIRYRLYIVLFGLTTPFQMMGHDMNICEFSFFTG